MHSPNAKHFVLVENGNAISGTHRLPTFCNSVGVVVLRCSNEQMVWVAARRVVALVANNHSCRDVSVCDGVCNPRCRAVFSAQGKRPIPFIFSTNRCSPRPAFIGRTNVNFCPKPGAVFVGDFCHAASLAVSSAALAAFSSAGICGRSAARVALSSVCQCARKASAPSIAASCAA